MHGVPLDIWRDSSNIYRRKTHSEAPKSRSIMTGKFDALKHAVCYWFVVSDLRIFFWDVCNVVYLEFLLLTQMSANICTKSYKMSILS